MGEDYCVHVPYFNNQLSVFRMYNRAHHLLQFIREIQFKLSHIGEGWLLKMEEKLDIFASASNVLPESPSDTRVLLTPPPPISHLLFLWRLNRT